MTYRDYKGQLIEERISQILEFLITVLFFIILCITILLVVLRYVFNSSITGGNELMEYLFIYTTSIGAAVALGRRDHIKITYFLEKLSQPWRMIVEVLGMLLISFINIVIFNLSFHWIQKVGSSESPVMRIPNWLVQISVPIGCMLAVLYALFDSYKIIVDGLRGLSKGKEL